MRESISIKILDLSGNNILTAPEGDDEAAENGANALKVTFLLGLDMVAF